MPRQEFSRKVRRAIFERAQGKCECCRAILKVGEGEIDHRIPDALGGKPELSNGWCLCRICHGKKTRADVGRVRKADRQRDKNTPAIRPKGQIPQRPKAARVGKPPVPRRGGIRFWPISGHSESGD